MAIISPVSIGTGPTVSYENTSFNAERISNSTITYTFKFKPYLTSNASKLQYGNELIGYIVVKNASGTTIGTSAEVKIKDGATEPWGPNEAYTRQREFTIVVNVASSAADEIYYFTLYVHKGASTDPTNTSVGNASLGSVSSLALLYTNVVNPTNFEGTSNTGIYKPDGEFKLQWSTGSDGTNNSVKGYEIGWNTTGSLTSFDSTVLIDGLNHSWPLNNRTRGAKYYFFIRTIGQIEGYNAPWMLIPNQCLINRLPPKPNVTGRVKLPASATEATWDISLSNDADGQSLTLYYSNSLNGEKRKLEGVESESELKLTIEFGNSNRLTYYFWAWDNCEYSEPAYLTIARNTQIGLTVNSDENAYPGVNIEAEAQGDNLQYQFKLFQGNTKIHEQAYGTLNKYILSDVRQYTSGYSQWTEAQELKVEVTIKDDMGDTKQEDVFIVISPLPPFKDEDIFNNASSTNIGNSKHFCQQLRLYYNGNTSLLESVDINIIVSGYNALSSKVEINNGYCDIGFSQLLPYGKEFTFIIRATSKTNKNLSWDLLTFKRSRPNAATPTNIITNNISSLLSNPGAIVSPFSMFAYGDSDAQSTELFSLDFNSLSCYWIFNNYQSLNLPFKIEERNGTTFNYIVSNLNLWNTLYNSELSRSIYYQRYDNVTLVVTAKNVFGESFCASAITTIDFRETPIFSGNPVLRLGAIDSEDNFSVLYEDGTWVQEGVRLAWDPWVNSGTRLSVQDFFGFENDEIEVRVDRGDGNGYVSLARYRLQCDLEEGLLTPNERKIFTLSVDDIAPFFYEVNEISTTSNRKFRLYAKNLAGQEAFTDFMYGGDTEYQVKSHVAPVCNITSGSYDDENGRISLALSFEKRSSDIGDNLTYKLFEPKTNSTIVSNDGSITNWTIDYGKVEGRFVKITIHATTILSQQFDEEHVAKSEQTTIVADFLVYNVLPTVAYRENHIGINTENIDAGAVLQVFPSTGRDYVVFSGSDGQEIKFNLTSGQIVQCIIDCGSW